MLAQKVQRTLLYFLGLDRTFVVLEFVLILVLLTFLFVISFLRRHDYYNYNLQADFLIYNNEILILNRIGLLRRGFITHQIA